MDLEIIILSDVSQKGKEVLYEITSRREAFYGRGHYQALLVYKQVLLSLYSDVQTEAETVCDLLQAPIPELGLVLDLSDPKFHAFYFTAYHCVTSQ